LFGFFGHDEFLLQNFVERKRGRDCQRHYVDERQQCVSHPLAHRKPVETEFPGVETPELFIEPLSGDSSLIFCHGCFSFGMGLLY